jgi:predicted nuclease of predicted toxin-antitoxin system
MTLWLDAQISPAIAVWLRMRFDLDVHAVRDLGLRDAEDTEIFEAACKVGAVVMTKDSDFVELLQRQGSPPQIIWLRSGNTSNARLKQLLSRALPAVLSMLEAGEPLVEIGDAW